MLNRRGVILARQNDLEQAAECVRRAVEIDPQFQPAVTI
ncbi:MAG: tetratricopeptide repeat protein [Pirellulaceae bacterium]